MSSGIRSVTIVGGGAAGLASAIFAKQTYPLLNVTILERKRETGKKILMSGGSRCNVLPKIVNIKHDYFGEDMNIAKKILSSWNVEDCHKWLSKDIGLHLELEKETNKYFPQSNSARDVRDRLLEKCLGLGVQVIYDRRVDDIYVNGEGKTRFNIKGVCEKDGEKKFNHTSDAVVLSTGGLSFPLVGTDGRGYPIAKSLGHTINDTYPALTPLKGMPIGDEYLPGISLDVGLKVSGIRKSAIDAERSGFLFTHKGFSGPSILDLSHHCIKALESRDKSIQLPILSAQLDGADKKEWEARLSNSASNPHGSQLQLVSNRIGQFIPSRLVQAVMKHTNTTDIKIGQLSTNDRVRLVDALSNMPINYTGHDGYRKAEVTGGGVPLSQINHQTLESKKQPGLFMCGEILDVFGRIGGFNFYWAWVTGRLVGKNICSNQE